MRDLPASLIDELEIGSHRARNARHAQMLRDQHAPFPWVAAATYCAWFVVACAASIFVSSFLGPIDFNPFSR